MRAGLCSVPSPLPHPHQPAGENIEKRCTPSQRNQNLRPEVVGWGVMWCRSMTWEGPGRFGKEDTGQGGQNRRLLLYSEFDD